MSVVVNVLNMSGEQVGTVELNEAVFGVEPNQYVVHEMVKNYLANQRQGTQSAKTRGEVSGGGKKPWRQKGTGHARQGSTRAPQWTHGGVAFAPKPRSYRYRVNKKVRRLALKSVLSDKVSGGNLIVIDEIKLENIKTKDFRVFLNALKIDGKSLVITRAPDKIVYYSARNLPGVLTCAAMQANVYDITNAKNLIIDRSALEILEKVALGEGKQAAEMLEGAKGVSA